MTTAALHSADRQPPPCRQHLRPGNNLPRRQLSLPTRRLSSRRRLLLVPAGAVDSRSRPGRHSATTVAPTWLAGHSNPQVIHLLSQHLAIPLSRRLCRQLQ